MAEYFGFQDPGKVSAAPTLDWATVANTVATTLQKDAEDRQKLRDEDRKITNDNLDTLSKADLGADQTMNQQLTNAIYDNKKLQNEWYKQLTSGKMSRQDYASKTQALKNNWGVLNNVVKNKAATDKLLMDAIQSNTQDALTTVMAEKAGTLQNLKNKKLYTDPISGAMVVADVDENGKIIESTMMDINALNNMQVNAAKRVDVPTELKPIADRVAKFVTDNGIRSLEDATRTGSYQQMRKSAQDFVLSSDRRIADVLVNSSGEGYFITTDPNEAKSNPLAILAKGTGGNFEVVLDEKVDADKIKKAQEVVGKALDNQMPFVEEVTLPKPISDGGGGRGKQEKVPSLLEVKPLSVNNNVKGGFIVVDDPGQKVGSTIERVKDVGIDENGVPFTIVQIYNAKETLNSATGQVEFTETGAAPIQKIYYAGDKGRTGENRIFSPTEYTRYRSRAGFNSDGQLKQAIESKLGININLNLGKKNQSNKGIDEGKIQYLLKQNPGATRQQIIDALKNK